MLQCSLLVEKHDNNSNLKNEDGEAFGVSFWGVFLSKIDFKETIGDALIPIFQLVGKYIKVSFNEIF